MGDKDQEYNATIGDLKKGDFFKFFPEDDINIVMEVYNKKLRYFEMKCFTRGSCPLIECKAVIIIARKSIIKKDYRHAM